MNISLPEHFDEFADARRKGFLAVKELKESGKKASELFGSCPRYPQTLINVPVADNDAKKAIMSSDKLWSAVRAEEEQLADKGRILVRASGTEALMRVMVEAESQTTATACAERLVELLKSL